MPAARDSAETAAAPVNGTAPRVSPSSAASSETGVDSEADAAAREASPSTKRLGTSSTPAAAAAAAASVSGMYRPTPPGPGTRTHRRSVCLTLPSDADEIFVAAAASASLDASPRDSAEASFPSPNHPRAVRSVRFPPSLSSPPKMSCSSTPALFRVSTLTTSSRTPSAASGLDSNHVNNPARCRWNRSNSSVGANPNPSSTNPASPWFLRSLELASAASTKGWLTRMYACAVRSVCAPRRSSDAGGVDQCRYARCA